MKTKRLENNFQSQNKTDYTSNLASFNSRFVNIMSFDKSERTF